jgi:hypothetical protein
VIAYEVPPVVELEEMLDDQVDAEAGRAARQIALVVVLSIVGLAGVAVLATMLIPVVAEVLRWIVVTIRMAQGS